MLTTSSKHSTHISTKTWTSATANQVHQVRPYSGFCICCQKEKPRLQAFNKSISSILLSKSDCFMNISGIRPIAWSNGLHQWAEKTAQAQQTELVRLCLWHLEISTVQFPGSSKRRSYYSRSSYLSSQISPCTI